MTDPVRCEGCGNWLGVRLPDGRIEQHHRHRRSVGRLDSITCEKCGAEWSADAEQVLSGQQSR